MEVNKRPNQIVDDVESISDQPVQKSARREEEQSSNALSRKESDKELEKSESARQFDVLYNEIVRLRRRLESTNDSMDELTRENATLKDKFEAAKRDEEIAKKMHFELAAKNFALKEDLDESRRKERDSSLKISTLKKIFDETRRKAEEDRINDGARIDDLTRKLTQYEGQKPAKDLLAMQQGLKRLMHTGGNRETDILKLCFLNTDANSIPLDKAVSQLDAKWNDECGKDSYMEYCKNNGITAINMKCAYCKVTVKHEIVDHFLSQKHLHNVSSIGATVSLPAVQHWLQKLQHAIEHKKELSEQLLAIVRKIEEDIVSDFVPILKRNRM